MMPKVKVQIEKDVFHVEKGGGSWVLSLAGKRKRRRKRRRRPKSTVAERGLIQEEKSELVREKRMVRLRRVLESKLKLIKEKERSVLFRIKL